MSHDGWWLALCIAVPVVRTVALSDTRATGGITRGLQLAAYTSAPKHLHSMTFTQSSPAAQQVQPCIV